MAICGLIRVLRQGCDIQSPAKIGLVRLSGQGVYLVKRRR